MVNRKWFGGEWDLLDLCDQWVARSDDLPFTGQTRKASSTPPPLYNAVVSDRGDQQIEDVEVFELLAQLCDRSLVILDQTGPELRYRLLETVRQYGRDLLVEDARSSTLYSRHLDYYVSLAEASEPKLKGRDQLPTLALLEREYENLRAALERGTSGEGSEQVMRLASNLALFWWRQGHLAEGTEWCLRATATPTGQKRSILRARVLNGAGLLTSFQGDCLTARSYFEESLEIHLELDDRTHLAETLCGLGFACFFLDDYEGAQRYGSEAYAAAVELGDAWYTAWSVYFLGIIARVQGDYDGAIRSYEEGIAIYRKLGDRIGASYPIYDIGLAEYYRGNLEAASRYLTESLAIRRETNDVWGVSESLFGLGLVAIGQKDSDRARERLLESTAIAREIGDKTRIAICAHWLGQVALVSGDVPEAIRLTGESFEIYKALEDRWGLAHCLAGYASLAARVGDWEKAVRLWSYADQLRDEIGSPLPPMERAQREEQLTAARAALPGFEAAFLEGRRLELQEALALAVSDLSSG